jgi:signal peptidase II
MRILREQRLFWIAFILILADQATKIWVKGFTLFGVVHQGMYLHESVEVLGDILRWTYVENPGMAFGIEFGWGKIFLSLFSVLATIGLGWLLYRMRTAHIGIQITIMLLLAGATGNLIDRVFYGVLYNEAPLFYGKVVDFVDIDIPDIHLGDFNLTRWYVFNIADSCVTCGIILLILLNKHIAIEPSQLFSPNGTPKTEEVTDTDNETANNETTDND